MDYYSSQINKLIQELSELPGIGAKSASAPGISYPEYAGRAGGGAFECDHRCEKECPVL